jgi:hypothetical protein
MFAPENESFLKELGLRHGFGDRTALIELIHSLSPGDQVLFVVKNPSGHEVAFQSFGDITSVDVVYMAETVKSYILSPQQENYNE